jgi:hypothetical protein
VDNFRNAVRSMLRRVGEGACLSTIRLVSIIFPQRATTSARSNHRTGYEGSATRLKIYVFYVEPAAFFFLRSVALRKEANTEGKLMHRLAVSEEIPRNAVYIMIRCG